MAINRKLDYVILDLIESAAKTVKSAPLNLGGLSGAGGGIGSPPGGFIGQLPQTRVAYDEDEIASSGIPASGMSLLDNLNHIRYRLEVVESGGGTGSGISSISIEQDGLLLSSSITVLNFEGANVSVLGSTATITISGGSSGAGTTISSYIPYTEDLSTQIPAALEHYTLLREAASGTLKVYYDGIRQREIEHYTVDPDLSGITLLFSTEVGDSLLVDYDEVIVSSGVAGGSGGAIIGNEAFPLHVGMWVGESSVLVGSNFTFIGDGGHEFTNYWFQNGPADGDTFEQTFVIASGNYNITFVGVTDNNRGIQDVYIDSAYIDSIDWYTFDNTLSQKFTLPITISTNGRHTIKSVVNGKNIASSDYYMAIGRITIKPA